MLVEDRRSLVGSPPNAILASGHQPHELTGAQPKRPQHPHYYYQHHHSFPQPHSVPHPLPEMAPISVDKTINRSLVRPNNLTSPTQPESTNDLAYWLEVTLKRPVKQTPQRPPNDTHPRVPRNQCIIVHGLPEIRADRVAQETRNDIEKRCAVVKAVVPPGKQILILKTQRLGPRGANPPTSALPLRVVVSDQAAHDLLMKSRFQLCNLYLQVVFILTALKKKGRNWKRLVRSLRHAEKKERED